MTEQSTEVTELAKALALAQAEMNNAKMGSINPFFKGPGKPEGSKYADLASVWEACRGPLTKHGLSVVQLPVSEAGTKRVGVETTLFHVSGQWKKGTVFATPEKETAQALGSCITYLRRYSLAAVASVCPEDDDGNEASGNKKSEAPKPPRANTVKHEGAKASHKQVAYLHMLKQKVGGMSEDMYRKQLAAFKDAKGQPIVTSTDLSDTQISNLIDRYEAKIKQQEERASQQPDLDAAFTRAEDNARLRGMIEEPGAEG